MHDSSLEQGLNLEKILNTRQEGGLELRLEFLENDSSESIRVRGFASFKGEEGRLNPRF